MVKTVAIITARGGSKRIPVGESIFYTAGNIVFRGVYVIILRKSG